MSAGNAQNAEHAEGAENAEHSAENTEHAENAEHNAENAEHTKGVENAEHSAESAESAVHSGTDVEPRLIAPDTKDWTWVLRRPCPECGLDARTVRGPQIPTLVRQNATQWGAVLERADVRVRPAPQVWSPLEYACHVRDVCRVFDGRLALMLGQDEPEFPNWDQDEAAVVGRYHEADPEQVATELTMAADAAATGFALVLPEEWGRRGLRSNGASFTVETLGQYFVHDLVHHLHDVGG